MLSDIGVPSNCLGGSPAKLWISPYRTSALTHDIFRSLVIPQAEEFTVSRLPPAPWMNVLGPASFTLLRRAIAPATGRPLSDSG
jgi:hypothetical protein